MITEYFTFGRGHELAGHCQPIVARNEQEARKIMFRHYGNKWAFQYSEADFEKHKGSGYINEKLLDPIQSVEIACYNLCMQLAKKQIKQGDYGSAAIHLENAARSLHSLRDGEENK